MVGPAAQVALAKKLCTRPILEQHGEYRHTLTTVADPREPDGPVYGPQLYVSSIWHGRPVAPPWTVLTNPAP